MAVVQISKIQVRRGKKYSPTGVPQLSSGELAWAVDSQELYIGNGSVAEGAPEVNNTKILTEHDNLLALLGNYRYAENALNTFPYSQGRSLQSKLDETVSLLDFIPEEIVDNIRSGGNGPIDGAVYHGASPFFQAAVDHLFLNPNPLYKKRLLIPTGTFKLIDDVYIPSGAVIVGENPMASVLMLGTSSTPSTVYFKNVNGQGPGSFTGNLLPINITLSNFAFDTTYGKVDISGLRDSKFDSVTFNGGYADLGDPIDFPAVYCSNTILGTRTNNIEFANCKFKHVDIGLKMIQTAALETIFNFSHCEFAFCGRGIWIDGTATQSNLWTIDSCVYDEIATEAIWADNGIGMKVNQSTFIRCGNGANGDIIPYTAIVSFGENGDNCVSDCSFTRSQVVATQVNALTPAVPEVENGKVTIANIIKKNVTLGSQPLTVFSSSIRQLELDYTLILGTGQRTGRLMITVNLAGEITDIRDEYSYIGNAIIMEGLSFTASFLNNDPDANSTKETLMLNYNNPVANATTGTIKFVARYSV
jgi:hypothetical protein